MMNIKYFLFLTLVAFSYQLSHCLQSHKICNPYGSSNVPQCTIGFATQCYECQIGYSLSIDRTNCLNIANCAYFDEDGECDRCDNYYNFDDEGNCVNDHCMLYNDDEDGGKTCYQCYLGFYVKNGNCERIPFKYCIYGDENSCTQCVTGANLENGECKVPSTFIDGCYEYNDDRTCKTCWDGYKLENGSCTLQNCEGKSTLDQCLLCEDGYYLSPPSYQCYSYDGREKTTSDNSNDNGNKAATIDIKFTIPLLMLLLLI